MVNFDNGLEYKPPLEGYLVLLVLIRGILVTLVHEYISL